ncbi:hypothetical protein KPL78_13435 [Roseomonas sp. HJA6]|uniref:Uncharacterized protein n=1 Tax=Roseomonas alba TaxID=2846776 RepID=A0ABS7A978_9PROT|nr:hypothetical protein [Neoroseomonas alba]MBW6398861.1 hypothetical protein [Neoroseomonas alba]
MNHIVEPRRLGMLRPSEHVSLGVPQDPIAAATHAIERILAAAHEAGQDDAVRLLHAVTALLSAAPRQ